MEKVNYTITLEDCSDYVKYQIKIKRIRKFLMKAFIPFSIIGLIFVLIMALPFICEFYHFFVDIMSSFDFSFWQAIFYKVTWFGAWSAFSVYISSVLPFIIMWFLIFGLSILFYICDPFHVLSKRVYKMLQGGALDVELETKEDGLFAQGKGMSSMMNWDGIIDIYDTGKIFLVFVSDYRAVLVPRRAFSSQEKADEFLEYVEEQLKKSKV